MRSFPGTYIEAKLRGGKPSYGHIALATLMRGDLARVVWTTNFDTLVADACAKVYNGTGLRPSLLMRLRSVGMCSTRNAGR